MKRFLVAGLAVLLWVSQGLAFEASKGFNSMAVNGTSIWQVDLTGMKSEEQLAATLVTGASSWTTGTTVVVYAAACNENLSTTQLAGTNALPTLDWKVVMWGVDIVSGVTRGSYPLEIHPAKTVVLKVLNGIYKASFSLALQGQMGGLWVPPTAKLLQESVYSISAVAGNSPFSSNDDAGKAVPDGAGFMLIKAPGSGSSVYVTTNSTIDRNANLPIEAGDSIGVVGNKVEFQRYRVGEAVTGVKPIVYYWSRRP